MTEMEALKKCIKVWAWLADHPDEIKKTAYYVLGLSKDKYECALCEYTISTGNMCGYCPLYGKWNKNNNYNTCMDRNSYYTNWQNYCIKYDRASFLKKYYARKIKVSANKIVLACEERLKGRESPIC